MKTFLENNINAMKADLKDLVSVNSVYNDDVAPFGSGNRLVLDKALKKMSDIGLRTKNLDYYCGYGEAGVGNKVIGIVAHLDVVPTGDGWDHDPFDMVEKDGMLYGRGVSDDKGGVVASMYALKYLIESGYQFKNRVRLIVGCNEETGSACIRHYVEKEGHVDMGFTPDGNFPGIYAEKGMVGATLKGNSFKIKDIKGGVASNVVCKKVEACISNEDYDAVTFKNFMDTNGIEYKIDGENIVVYGKAAHASTPDLGVNAINYLMEALYVSKIDDPFVDFYHKYIGLSLHGEKLGMEALKDDITNASVNIGVISKDNGVISASFDMRYPVKTNTKAVKEVLADVKGDQCEFVIRHCAEPLYFDLKSPMIQALDKAYRDVTGDYESQMEAIGGGTYAKAINNIIAFGCEFQGEDNHIHDANEVLSIESFKKQVLIYIEAIKNLDEAA